MKFQSWGRNLSIAAGLLVPLLLTSGPANAIEQSQTLGNSAVVGGVQAGIIQAGISSGSVSIVPVSSLAIAQERERARERNRGDRARGDRRRDDRARGDRRRDDRARGDRRRDDRARGDRRRDDRARDDRRRDDRADNRPRRRDGRHSGARRDQRSDYRRRATPHRDYRRDDNRGRNRNIRDRRYARGPVYSRPVYSGRRYAHGFRSRSSHGYFCADHGLFHYFAGFDPFGFSRVASYGRPGYRYASTCYPVEKVDFHRGRKAIIGGILCYDGFDRPYIQRGSRYVKSYY